MPKCQNCKRQWSYIETLKCTWDFGKNMKCSYCGRQQYLTKESRKKTMMTMFFMIAPLALFFNSSQLLGLGALAVICVLYILIWPFLVELSSKENSSQKK